MKSAPRSPTFVRLGAVIFLFSLQSFALADEVSNASHGSEVEIIDFQGETILWFKSEIATAVMKAREEAEKQKVSLDLITRYTVIIGRDDLRVTLAPEAKGGLDGPEFWIEFRRSDMKITKINNKLKEEDLKTKQ